MLNSLSYFSLAIFYYLIYRDKKIAILFLLNLIVILLSYLRFEVFFMLFLLIYLIIRNKLSKKLVFDNIGINIIVLLVLCLSNHDDLSYFMSLLCTGMQVFLLWFNYKLYSLKQLEECKVSLYSKLHELENIQLAEELFGENESSNTRMSDLNRIFKEYQAAFHDLTWDMKWIVEDVVLPLNHCEAVSLICNLFNNIMNHGQSTMYFQCSKEADRIVIITKNDKLKEKSNNSIKHGHGLKMIRDIVYRYNGEVIVKENEDEFVVMILF